MSVFVQDARNNVIEAKIALLLADVVMVVMLKTTKQI